MVFYVTEEMIRGDRLVLSPEDAHHVGRVLRMRPGEELRVCDHRGLVHRCTLTLVDRDAVEAVIEASAPCKTEPTVAVTVYAGLAKGERFDLLVQKCVECGVGHIVPFTSRNCVVRLDKGDAEKKQKRYARIALEASMQCNRGAPVTVGGVLTFEEAVRAAGEREHGFFLYEQEGSRSLSQALSLWSPGQSVAVVTGPEGGFTPAERDAAVAWGLESLSLGPRILRCETAPVAALCAIMYHTGNFDAVVEG